MPTAPEYAFKEKSTKLLILPPLRTIYLRTFQCETPCMIKMYFLSSRWLSFKKFFVVDFLCNFHMATYPFDTQDCNAEIELGKSRQFVELFAQNMEYDGEMHVMEYIITEWKDYKEKNKLVLKISLGRSLMSVILTTMLPTIILILVALSTN